MAVTVREELQDEVLSTLRKGQEITLDAVKTVVKTIEFITPAIPAVRVPLADRLPSPHEMVAGTNDFAEHLLANQRQFADEVIEVASPLLPGQAAKTRSRVIASAAPHRAAKAPSRATAPAAPGQSRGKGRAAAAPGKRPPAAGAAADSGEGEQ